MQAAVFGFVNHAHAATAQLIQDAVMRYGLADHKADVRQRCHLRDAATGSQSPFVVWACFVRQSSAELEEDQCTSVF